MYWRIDEETSKDHWINLLDASCLQSNGEDNIWWRAAVRWDGCIHLDTFGNIPLELDPDRKDPACCDDYIHICDLDRYIERLQEMREIAQEYFKDQGGSKSIGEWRKK